MNSTSSTGQPTAIVSTPNAADLNWIDWLCLNYPTHSRQEIQEFYLSRYGSIEAARYTIDGYRRNIVEPAGSSLRRIGVRSF